MTKTTKLSLQGNDKQQSKLTRKGKWEGEKCLTKY